MGYTNSPLVDCTIKSPNNSGLRTHKIDRITPHCVVGQISAETIGNCFLKSSAEASCNYGIGMDGRVCLVVDEANRSWCTSSRENDQRAITIECASDTTAPWAFKEVVYQKLVKLCIDICKRNGIKQVYWWDNKDKALNYNPKDGECVLTVHRWYANKACPGDWMYARMGKLAAEINAGIGGKVEEVPDIPMAMATEITSTLRQGSKNEEVKLLQAYLNKLGFDCGDVDGSFGPATLAAVKAFQSKNNLDPDGVVGPMTRTTLQNAIQPPNKIMPYKVKVTASALYYRDGPGSNFKSNGIIRKNEIYTVVDESDGQGATKWGKLLSGAGWISLDYIKRV